MCFHFSLLFFSHCCKKESRRLSHCWSIESHNLLSLLVFGVGTWEALILLPLVRKNLASIPHMNGKYAILHSNLIKLIPQPIPLKFSSDAPLVYWDRNNICNPAFGCLVRFWATQSKETWKNWGKFSRRSSGWSGQTFDLWTEAEESGFDQPREGKGWRVITAAPSNNEESIRVTDQGNSISLSS